MPALSDPVFLASAGLALLSAIVVTFLGIRAYRGIKRHDGDDDRWNAPPSQ
jgi:hypothetical protein